MTPDKPKREHKIDILKPKRYPRKPITATPSGKTHLLKDKTKIKPVTIVIENDLEKKAPNPSPAPL